MNNIDGWAFLVLYVVVGINLWRMRRVEKGLAGKVDKRIMTPSRLRKHVPSNPVHQTSPDGKKRIVGYQCSVCDDTSVSKGGHTVKQCEAFKFAEMRREQDAEAGNGVAGNGLGRPGDPPREE